MKLTVEVPSQLKVMAMRALHDRPLSRTMYYKTVRSPSQTTLDQGRGNGMQSSSWIQAVVKSILESEASTLPMTPLPPPPRKRAWSRGRTMTGSLHSFTHNTMMINIIICINKRRMARLLESNANHFNNYKSKEKFKTRRGTRALWIWVESWMDLYHL